jgi:hypothetical protein
VWQCSHQANEGIKLFELAEQYQRLSDKAIGPLVEAVSVNASGVVGNFKYEGSSVHVIRAVEACVCGQPSGVDTAGAWWKDKDCSQYFFLRQKHPERCSPRPRLSLLMIPKPR